MSARNLYAQLWVKLADEWHPGKRTTGIEALRYRLTRRESVRDEFWTRLDRLYDALIADGVSAAGAELLARRAMKMLALGITAEVGEEE